MVEHSQATRHSNGERHCQDAGESFFQVVVEQRLGLTVVCVCADCIGILAMLASQRLDTMRKSRGPAVLGYARIIDTVRHRL